eukprot:XP_016860968.1 uncharacterized protein LOC107985939 [Homo sapiens]
MSRLLATILVLPAWSLLPLGTGKIGHFEQGQDFETSRARMRRKKNKWQTHHLGTGLPAALEGQSYPDATVVSRQPWEGQSYPDATVVSRQPWEGQSYPDATAELPFPPCCPQGRLLVSSDAGRRNPPAPESLARTRPGGAGAKTQRMWPPSLVTDGYQGGFG